MRTWKEARRELFTAEEIAESDLRVALIGAIMGNEAIDDLQDIADAKEIEARIQRGEGEYFPAEVVNAILDGANPVKVYREYRNMTQAELAQKAGLSADMIKKIESGKSDGSLKSLKAIAAALNVDIEDII